MATDQEFSPFISDMDKYLFGSGTHYDIYKKLGAHVAEKDGKEGVYFAVWAPDRAGYPLSVISTTGTKMLPAWKRSGI